MEQYLKQKLNELFHYSSFRTGQLEIILDIMQGNNVFGILPTGTGKSLCYQLLSKLLPGITVVISPLISLMIDQVRETKAYYFKEVAAIHSFQSMEERYDILHNLHHYKLVYLSPELIQQPNILQQLHNVSVDLFVIDEAHCISQWGHDFRPDYLRLKQWIKKLGNPPVLALTGTATDEVIQDVIKQLDATNMNIHRYDAERKNIGLIVEHIDRKKQTKYECLLEIAEATTEPTIIYFSSRKMTESIASKLQNDLKDRSIAYYHGGMDAEERLKIQQQFLYDQIDIICATSAFGMGINKPNIRYVIHYHLPAQIESFIQEIGRAGRDGEQSYSILLFEAGDETIPLNLIENELPNETEIKVAFTFLHRCYEKKIRLFQLEELFSTRLQFPTSKIRFLLYHFETNGMIKENTIFYNERLWNESMKKIISFCHSWNENKRTLLQKMIAYIYSRTCFRQNLYAHFQQSVSTGQPICCSNCNIKRTMLKDEPKKRNLTQQSSWQKQLALILGIENEHETT